MPTTTMVTPKVRLSILHRQLLKHFYTPNLSNQYADEILSAHPRQFHFPHPISLSIGLWIIRQRIEPSHQHASQISYHILSDHPNPFHFVSGYGRL
jgi:hypothetical protein